MMRELSTTRYIYDARLRPSGRDVEQLSTTRWVGSRSGTIFIKNYLRETKLNVLVFDHKSARMPLNNVEKLVRNSVFVVESSIIGQIKRFEQR